MLREYGIFSWLLFSPTSQSQMARLLSSIFFSSFILSIAAHPTVIAPHKLFNRATLDFSNWAAPLPTDLRSPVCTIRCSFKLFTDLLFSARSYYSLFVCDLWLMISFQCTQFVSIIQHRDRTGSLLISIFRLANHGFLPRDGRNVNAGDVIKMVKGQLKSSRLISHSQTIEKEKKTDFGFRCV